MAAEEADGVRRALFLEFDSTLNGGELSPPQARTAPARAEAEAPSGGPAARGADLVRRKYRRAKQLLASQAAELQQLRTQLATAVTCKDGGPQAPGAASNSTEAHSPAGTVSPHEHGCGEAGAMAAAAAAIGATPTPGRYAEVLAALRSDNADLSTALAAERLAAHELQRRADAARAAAAAHQASAAAALAAAAAAEEGLREARAGRTAAEAEAERQREGAAHLAARLEAQRRGLHEAEARLRQVSALVA
jgi:hypothetical protein